MPYNSEELVPFDSEVYRQVFQKRPDTVGEYATGRITAM